MTQTFSTASLLHGGDYNPEQWLNQPEILEKDMEYFKKAKINTVTLGIFSWAVLEPEEDRYEFEWLKTIINRLYENGISTILATPSGARPKWLADKYPEVLRVDEKRRRALFGGRHNHCFTSPVYREKVKAVNTELARRFGSHPGVILWHISLSSLPEAVSSVAEGKIPDHQPSQRLLVHHLLEPQIYEL